VCIVRCATHVRVCSVLCTAKKEVERIDSDTEVDESERKPTKKVSLGKPQMSVKAATAALEANSRKMDKLTANSTVNRRRAGKICKRCCGVSVKGHSKFCPNYCPAEMHAKLELCRRSDEKDRKKGVLSQRLSPCIAFVTSRVVVLSLCSASQSRK
jgi:hypothetical protein